MSTFIIFFPLITFILYCVRKVYIKNIIRISLLYSINKSQLNHKKDNFSNIPSSIYLLHITLIKCTHIPLQYSQNSTACYKIRKKCNFGISQIYINLDNYSRITRSMAIIQGSFRRNWQSKFTFSFAVFLI